MGPGSHHDLRSARPRGGTAGRRTPAADRRGRDRAGLDLLPGGGEIGPRCSCPDDADPCKHSAAACYLVTDALDADPFVLLLLRGRTRDQVLAGVRARRRGAPADTDTAVGSAPTSEALQLRATDDEGVDARAAFSAPTPSAEIPAPPLPPARPGQPAALPVDPPAWRADLGSDLFELAADAAARAWEMAVGLSADSGLGLSADVDLARRAGRALGTPAFVKLAVRSGVGARELARQALAWRNGGLAGLELLHSEWDPATEEPEAPELLRAARSALRDKNDGAETVVEGNRITTGRLQLRLGRDLRWFPYARSDGNWEPSRAAGSRPRPGRRGPLMRSQRWSWQAPGHGEPPGEVGLKVVRWFDRHNDRLTDNPASRCHHHHAGRPRGQASGLALPCMAEVCHVIYTSSMALSIKSDEADELARELAAGTGETLTEAVVIALREQLDHEPAGHAASMRTRLARLAADWRPCRLPTAGRQRRSSVTMPLACRVDAAEAGGALSLTLRRP